jgi:phosphatidylinositol alpha-mannosyltransferase
VRIGMICPYSLSVPGGVQNQVLGLARAMRARGHDVRVLAPTDGPPPESWITSLGPSVLNPANGSVAPMAPNPPTQVRAIRALWDDHFDVIHAHEPLCPGPTVTAVVMKTAPMVGTFHAAGDQPAYKYLSWLARKMAKRLDVKVAVSEEARALARTAMPTGDFEVLFNGVEVERFRVPPWPRPPGRRVALFVGRHEERKGLAVFLEAVRSLPEDDLAVWVVGEGPQTDGLRARHHADHRIEWLGRVSDAERNARMAAADVFCAPSIGGESFGVILLEAMAAGAPVVASDITGYTAVAGALSGGPAAALLPRAGDAAALAAALRLVLDDPDTAAGLRAAGAARAELFSMERLSDHYLHLYAGLLASVD